MNLKRLQAFAAVYEFQSVTAAADQLNTTQPAVSRLVRELEAELGLDLFSREKRTLVPTPEGRAFFDEARVALAAVDQIFDIARDIRTLKHAQLRIVAPMVTAFGLLPVMVQHFQMTHPDVRISISVKDMRDIGDWVAHGPYDVGFGALPVEDDHIETEFLANLTQLLVMPEGHRLTRFDPVPLGELEGEPLILPSPRAPRRAILSALAQVGVTPVSLIETSAAISACQLAALGLGIGVADRYIYELGNWPGTIARATDPAIEFPLGLFFPLQRARSAAVKEFATTVRETLHDLGQMP